MPVYEAGKLDHDVLQRLLRHGHGSASRSVVIGPRLGEDAAVVKAGSQSLVIATDPVTFAADRLGWYAVQINANDVAVMGARPCWFQPCVLLPAGRGPAPDPIFKDMHAACSSLGIAITGGHTEVTQGITTPIVVGTMMGTAAPSAIVTSAGLRVGHDIVMTGHVAVEATALLARDFRSRLRGKLKARQLRRAAGFLFDPGISVVRAALTAADAGATAMHDPTEGGVLTGLWEMANASQRRVVVEPAHLPMREETRLVCNALGVDPLRALASGALLTGIPRTRTRGLLARLKRRGLPATVIGRCVPGKPGLVTPEGRIIPPRARDAVAEL